MDRAAYLTPHTAGDYEKMTQDGSRLFLSKDGKVGYVISKQGDLQNLFNNHGPRGAGAAAVASAIGNGARTLDCFGPFLPRLYHQMGFRAFQTLRFADEYAPEGWDYQEFGRPDVVFMELPDGAPTKFAKIMEGVGHQGEYVHPTDVVGYETRFDYTKARQPMSKESTSNSGIPDPKPREEQAREWNGGVEMARALGMIDDEDAEWFSRPVEDFADAEHPPAD